MVLGRITRGRHTDNLDGHHSIWTNQQSTSINPPIFTPHALPAATLPSYPGLGQVQEYAALHTTMAWLYPHGLVQFNKKWKKNQFGGKNVVGQTTVLTHWAQKVGERLHTLPNRLRRQWHIRTQFLFISLLSEATLGWAAFPKTEQVQQVSFRQDAIPVTRPPVSKHSRETAYVMSSK